jgi:hypothetical protein
LHRVQLGFQLIPLGLHLLELPFGGAKPLLESLDLLQRVTVVLVSTLGRDVQPPL